MMYEYVYGDDVSEWYENVKITIERITPEIAERMLKANVNNRKMKVGTLGKALKNKEWTLNGATIVFSNNGRLLDGQNRLAACVASGVSFDTIVVRGVSEDSQMTMDTNVVRSVADNLKMHGYTNTGQRSTVGLAILRTDTYGFEGMLTRANGYRQDFTIVQCVKFIEGINDDRIDPIMKDALKITNTQKALTLGPVAAFLDYLRQHGVSEDDYREFVSQTTMKSTPCPSVMALTNYMSNCQDKRKGSKPGKKTLAGILVKAWNAYMHGENTRVLQYRQGGASPERFPDIYIA